MSNERGGGVAPVRFFLGLIMIGAGGYLFFEATGLVGQLRFDQPLVRIGPVGIPPLLLAAPLALSLGLLLLDRQNLLGWLLLLATVAVLVGGVMLALRGRIWKLSGFEFGSIVLLFVGGTAFFLSSLGGSRRG